MIADPILDRTLVVPSPAIEQCRPELAIVVPTYNERSNVSELVTALTCALQNVQWEIVFVDDNSPDGTAKQIHGLAVTNQRIKLLERTGRRGLSSACIEGMLATSVPYVAVMDADLQHDERTLPEMLARLKSEDLDIVVGSRKVNGGSMGTVSRGRALLSCMGSKSAHFVCHCELSDPMSGFFVVRRSFFARCAARLEGIGFKLLLEIVTLSEVPPRVAEVPYTFRERKYGRSKFGLRAVLAYFQFLRKRLAEL